MPILEIDKSLCEGCGICAADCVTNIIEQDDDGMPFIAREKEKICYDCQHCLAVCPTGALSIHNRKAGDSLDFSEISLPSHQQIDSFIRFRRSCRSYQNKNVDPALLDKLMKTLAFSPTGTNCQELTFNLIDNKNTMRKFVETITDALIEASKNEEVLVKYPRIKRYAAYPRDVIMSMLSRNAPHALIVSADPSGSCADADVVIALAYFEFLAASAGLGTVWWGMLRFVLMACPEVKERIGIGADHPFYGMLFGIPAVQYARTTQKESAAKLHKIAL